MVEINITPQNQNQRIDKFILKVLPGMSKSFCYKMFRKKNITLNKKKISGQEICREGDSIQVYFTKETYNHFALKKPKNRFDEGRILDVVYEDDDLIVINKAAGILSQDDGSALSVVDQIRSHYEEKDLQMDTGFKVGVSNRLDRNTTGIILSAKSLTMAQMINRKIKNHEVTKLYRCIVVGKLDKEIELKDYIQKDHNHNKVRIDPEGELMIHTLVKPIRWNASFTELEIEIKTGKTHQIRVHLASIGHPIIGDNKYGNTHINHSLKQKYDINHQLLHAYSYQFIEGDIKLDNMRYYKPFIADYPDLYNTIAKAVFE
ncbi:RluA family pseudouridine synthase [Petrocella sp. FN5]|uniref:RluA family pseudouridine synthase n=1 Tax=Petrocella sp. FN5 TaxID=3032002 RepID=UPI0023D9ED02|nr:RluA family pseudouridine synthase [Petrocella sp. FN5]MDF1616353.1 RluA family pseudouridine synthase [Petrocella sp. FN5]